MPLVSTAKIGKMLNVSVRRVRQLVQTGVIPRADHGRYDPAKVLIAHHCYLQKKDRGSNGTGEEEQSGLRAARERLVLAQAAREELDLRKLQSELVPVSEYRQHLSQACMTIRERLLTLAPRLAPNLEGLDRGNIEATIEQEVLDILTTLAITDNGNGHHKPKPKRKPARARGSHRRSA